MSLGCQIPTPDELQKLDIDPAKQTEIEVRIGVMDALLQSTLAASKAEAAAQDAVLKNILLQNIQETAQMIQTSAIRAADARGWSAWLARNLGVSQTLFGLGEKYTQAGWVRQSLVRIRRLGSGGVQRAVRQAGLLEKQRAVYDELVSLLRSRGVRSKDIGWILDESQLLGWQRYFPRFFRIGKTGEQVLAGRVDNFIKMLQTNYGLGDADVQRIIVGGRASSDVYMKMTAIAQQLGISNKNMGYLPRFISDEAKMRFNWRYNDLKRGLVEFDDGFNQGIEGILTRSRTSHEYVVEDEVLLDWLLRQHSQQKYNDPGELYRKAGELIFPGQNISDVGLADVLENHHSLSRVLVDLEPELVDSLVDSGLLSKIPLPSSEILSRLIGRYRMPFESLDEVFAVDWAEGTRLYKEQLQKLAGESGFVNLLVQNAVNGKWGVNRATIEANPAEFRGFVPLVSYDAGLPGVLDKQMLTQFGYSKARQESMGLILQNTYVHPTVAELVKTQLELQTDPMLLGVLDRYIHGITTRFKELAITTLGYIPRQLYNTLFSQLAGGGDALLVPHYTARLLAVHVGKQPIESVLDNTKALFRTASGESLTELGLWHHLEDLGYISKFEPLTGTLTSPGGYHNWSIANVRRNVQWLTNAAQQNDGFARFADELGLQVGSAIDRLSYPLKFTNNLLDNAGRFAGIVSSLKRYDTNTPGLFAQRFRRLVQGGWNQHNTVEDAIEHWQHYYYMYDDFTKLDKIIGNYLVPFWAFHSKNIPAAVRHVVRNPTRFMAYQRIYSLLNRPVASEENSQLNEGTIQPWLVPQQNIYFRTEDGYFAVPLEPLDPVASARQWLESPAESVLGLFGIQGGSPKGTSERLDAAPWNETNVAIQSMLDNTYGIWKAAAATISNQDTMGRSLSDTRLTTFWGYEISPLTRTWLENLLPITGYINRINPGGRFGTPVRRDARTGTWTQGTPSQMPFSGNPPRTDSDSTTYGNPYQWLDWVGIKVYPVDTMLNAGFTYDDLRANVRQGNDLIRRMKGELLKMEPDSDAYRRQEERIAEVQYLVDETRTDLNRLDDWTADQGLDVKAAVQRLSETNRRIGDLEPDSPSPQTPPTSAPNQ